MTVQVMAAHGARDGLAMLKALVAADAIVWGLVDCHQAGSRPRAAGFGVMPELARKAQTVTDNAVRQAAIHLRQLLPPDSSVQREHLEYVRSLRHLAAAGVAVPDTMLRNLPEELAAKFAAAVANVRHPLATAGAPSAHTATACMPNCPEHGGLAISCACLVSGWRPGTEGLDPRQGASAVWLVAW